MPYGSNVSTFMLPLDAIQLLQAAFGKAMVESDVQAAAMTFFDVLSDEFQPGFFVQDHPKDWGLVNDGGRWYCLGNAVALPGLPLFT
jgi:hypothetical protein